MAEKKTGRKKTGKIRTVKLSPGDTLIVKVGEKKLEKGKLRIARDN